MGNDRLARLSRLCIVAFGGAAVIYIFMRYLLAAAAPFLAALLISSVTRRAAAWAAEKSGMPKKVCGAVTAALLLFFSAYAAVLLGGRIAREAAQTARALAAALESEDNIVRRALALVTEKLEKLPHKMGNISCDELYAFLSERALELLSSFGTRAGEKVTAFVAALPRTLFSTSVCVIAVFYLTADPDNATRAVVQLLPKRMSHSLGRVMLRLGAAASGYIKAYSALMGIIFGELFVGLLLLRVRYSFLAALLIAAVDILPVLGVGTVLVPWAVLLIVGGECGRGVGMLVLFALIYITRQLVEVRLVGRFMGIHPLLTLCGAFAGYSLFGLWGLVLSPMLIYLTKTALGLSEGDGKG